MTYRSRHKPLGSHLPQSKNLASHLACTVAAQGCECHACVDGISVLISSDMSRLHVLTLGASSVAEEHIRAQYGTSHRMLGDVGALPRRHVCLVHRYLGSLRGSA
jgi:hypothetical protein